MNRFDYVRPTSVQAAVSAGSAPGSVFLASGTNLLDLMKIGVTRPVRVVDLSALADLAEITWLPDGGVRLGALVRNSDLAYDARFARTFPAVAEALLSGASAQVRNAATLGGNLMQRSRCAYFQDTASKCNRRQPGSGCDALHGENRTHAVLGWSEHCIATNPSDFCVPLLGLDAIVETEGVEGPREIPLEALHLLPGTTPDQETALRPGELITGLRLSGDSAAYAGNARYLKIRERTSFAFALVSAFAALRIEDEQIVSARIALGGLAAKPWRARTAETSLSRMRPTPEAFAMAADLALTGAQPSGENAFKIDLARAIVARALSAALAGTPRVMPALPASPFSTIPGVTHVG